MIAFASRFSWVAALAIVLALLVFDSANRISHIQMVTRAGNSLVQPLEPDAQSASGYASGEREIVLPTSAIDGCHWIMQTQQMLAAGTGRIREVNYDNANGSREVHWASPFRWWLGLLAWIDHEITDTPTGQAVERAALYANPLLLGLTLLILVPLTARRLGALAASVLALGLIGSIPFHEYFVAGYADHHGLVAVCAIVCLLPLLTGGNEPAMRRYFIISAIAGGIGLWISTASMVPVLIGIGAGVLLGPFCKQTQPQDDRAALWRLWGRWGAATSVLAWLIEYFPSGLSWRLEINHPLYALAWLGAGELLFRWQREPGLGGFLKTSRERLISVLSLIAVVALPLVILFFPEKTFWISNSFLWALHNEYIDEFQSALKQLQERPLFFLIEIGTPLLVVTILSWIQLRRKNRQRTNAAVLLGLACIGIMLVLALRQVRWMGLSQALVVVLLVFLVSQLREAFFNWRFRLFVNLALAAMIGPAIYKMTQLFQECAHFTTGEIQQLVVRDVARWLHQRMGNESAAIVSSPALTTPLIFHGGLRATGSLYWENLPGLKTAAEFFGAHNPDEAWKIAREHGITHLVLISWNDSVEDYIRLVRDLPQDANLPDDAFVLNLMRTKSLPPWLRMVPCPLPQNPALEGEAVFVFEVVSPQAPEESLVRTIGFLLDMGQPATAEKMLPLLENQPASLSAQITLARLHWKLGHKDALITTLRQCLRLSGQNSMLTLEDDAHFAMLLTVAGAEDRARNELAACWAKADESSLRKLPAETLLYFLAANMQLKTEPPHSQFEFAIKLLPPERRKLLAPINN